MLRKSSGGGLSASPVNATSQAGGRAGRLELVLQVDDAAAGQLEPGAVELGVEVGDSGAVGELRRAGGERITDRGGVLLVLVQLADARLGLRHHLGDRRLTCGRGQHLAGGRGDHDAQRRALLGAELGVDQVGGLLEVRARHLELVHQRAVEGEVQPDQDQDDREPRADHAPRVAGAVAGPVGKSSRVCDSPFFVQLRAVRLMIGHSDCLPRLVIRGTVAAVHTRSPRTRRRSFTWVDRATADPAPTASRRSQGRERL